MEVSEKLVFSFLSALNLEYLAWAGLSSHWGWNLSHGKASSCEATIDEGSPAAGIEEIGF